MTAPALSFVVIGLNEGAHLEASLAALLAQGVPRERCQIVYVDSGSEDASLAIARAAGVDALVEIPRATANAARARNAGLARAEALLVHFVDGDTKLRPGWARDAMSVLAANAKLAGVEGSLKEARPDHSIVHRALQMDWPIEPGEVPFVGGNALYRAAAVRDAGGFDERLRLG
jgi:glycosyltransferase involved in cell wall biosynthesis